MDTSILERLLETDALMHQISLHVDLAGSRLISASPRPIDAPGYLSDLVGVTLTWDGATNAPNRAVLKVSHPKFGREELPFYQTVAARLNCSVIPRFFAGGTDELTGRTWLLMEDLSETHERPSEAPLPPTFARSARLVEALAQFHAARWGNTSLLGDGRTLWGRLRSSEWLGPAAERLFKQAGDALDDSATEMYERFQTGLPALAERAEKLQGKTLVHGDAHVWNWMLPRDDTVDEPKLIDWDGWHMGLGAWDLAYMIALQWDREVRQRFEMGLLERYHAALTSSGVTGYSREAFQEDYRLAVLLHLRTPVGCFARGMSAYVWWPQLTRIRQAVKDLDCLDLID